MPMICRSFDNSDGATMPARHAYCRAPTRMTFCHDMLVAMFLERQHDLRRLYALAPADFDYTAGADYI